MISAGRQDAWYDRQHVSQNNRLPGVRHSEHTTLWGRPEPVRVSQILISIDLLSIKPPVTYAAIPHRCDPYPTVYPDGIDQSIGPVSSVGSDQTNHAGLNEA